MTGKADFTEQEWDLVLSGPPTAGLMVIMADRGGTLRETVAMAKAYAEERGHHGESELLDEIVSARPEVDHTRFHSYDELREHGVGRLREAIALLQSKATPEEVDGYRRFIGALTERVARRHKEHGVEISEPEQRAI